MSKFLLLVRDEGREPPEPLEAVAGMSIGRAPDNQCHLSDPNAGRNAARIVEERGMLHIEDLGSTNRTGIRNGRKLQMGQREALRHGLVIEIGKSTIEVVAQGGGEEVTNPGSATILADSDRTFMNAPREEEFPTLRQPVVQPPASNPTPAPPRPMPPQPKTKPPPPLEPTRPPGRGQATPHANPTPGPVPFEPVEISRPSSSSTVDVLGEGTQSMRPATGDFGAIAAMINRRPRLVIVNEAIRRVEFLQKAVTSIGREDCDFIIDHKAISKPHATIRFVEATNGFQIEDRKSKNQTFVGTVALNPETPQSLSPECLVRFGPIEAVFVVDLDSDNARIPAAHYEGAVRCLQAQNQITAEQAKAAQEEAAKGERHVGEALMLAGAVSARTWARAFEMGKTALPIVPRKAGRRWVLVVVGVLALAAALTYVFRDALGL